MKAGCLLGNVKEACQSAKQKVDLLAKIRQKNETLALILTRHSAISLQREIVAFLSVRDHCGLNNYQ